MVELVLAHDSRIRLQPGPDEHYADVVSPQLSDLRYVLPDGSFVPIVIAVIPVF